MTMLANPSDERKTPAWQDQAIAAYAQQCADEKAAEQERFTTRAQRTCDLLARLGVPVAVGDVFPADGLPAFRVDGVTFAGFNDDGWTLVVILDDCPDCGRRVASGVIESAADLGKMLVGWEPRLTHHDDCPAHSPAPRQDCTPVEARLLVALKDWLEAG